MVVGVRKLLLLGSLLATLLVVPAARATSFYCIHEAGESCATLFPGTPAKDEGANLQAALEHAEAQASANAIVLIGPGTFTSAEGFRYSSPTIPVTINGSGIGTTFLEATGPNPFSVMTLIGSEESAITDATIVLTPQVVESGLLLSGLHPGSTTGARAFRLDIETENAAASGLDGAELRDGGDLEHSTVAAGQAGNGIGVKVPSGAAKLDDDTISGRFGVLGEGEVASQRLRISAVDGAISLTGATTSTFDGVLGVVSAEGAAGAAIGSQSKVTIRSGTFVDLSGTGIGWEAATSAASTSDQLTVLDSIQRGFDTPILCFALLEGGKLKGTPNITLGFDDVHLTGSEKCPNGGTFEPGSGDIDADPQFVDSTSDFHLRFGSPAIDAGGPGCSELCQDSDLDGLKRPIDGDGNGTATRDMGAYEYGRRSPSAVASTGPAAPVTGVPVTFSGAGSSDPDDGDVLTYTWTFDDGATASGAAVTHIFTTAGMHSATLTVTDPAGLTSSATVSLVVSPAPLASLLDTTPPTISSLRVSPSTFAVAKGATAKIAAAKRHHRGTKIEFKLSEPAAVTVSFSRRVHGVKVGHSCVARSRKHRHGKRCTRFAGAGALKRRSEPAGAVAIAFTGRLGRAALVPGSYRLTLTAVDPSGNRSKPLTGTFTVVRG